MATDNRVTTRETFFTAQAADGVGDPMNVDSLGNINVTLIGTGTAVFTVKVQGSDQKTAPDFSSASVDGNEWSYLGSWDLNTIVPIVGTTGYTFAADETVRLLVNTDRMSHVNLEVSGYATGALTARGTASSNE